MGTDDYGKALSAAEAELESVVGKLEVLGQRQAQLQQTIGALRMLMNVSLDEERTLTDTIRILVKGAGGYIGSAEVIKGAYAMGAKFSGKNPIASVTTILARLHKEGELERDILSGTYRWKRPVPRAPKPLTEVGGRG